MGSKPTVSINPQTSSSVLTAVYTFLLLNDRYTMNKSSPNFAYVQDSKLVNPTAAEVIDPVFSAYRDNKPASTLNTHDRNLTLLVQFLVYCQFYPRTVAADDASLQAQVKYMSSSSAPWHLITWGHLAGFKRWLTTNGHTTSSVDKVLATVKKYQALATQSDASRNRTLSR